MWGPLQSRPRPGMLFYVQYRDNERCFFSVLLSPFTFPKRANASSGTWIYLFLFLVIFFEVFCKRKMEHLLFIINSLLVKILKITKYKIYGPLVSQVVTYLTHGDFISGSVKVLLGNKRNGHTQCQKLPRVVGSENGISRQPSPSIFAKSLIRTIEEKRAHM